jgi:hypothetical protein
MLLNMQKINTKKINVGKFIFWSLVYTGIFAFVDMMFWQFLSTDCGLKNSWYLVFISIQQVNGSYYPYVNYAFLFYLSALLSLFYLRSKK